MKAPDGLKEKLFGQVEKISKFSKEIQLKSLIIAYEKIFLNTIKNMTTETFVTELNENISTCDLILFSVETKMENKLHLISPNNKLKFNLKKYIYKNRLKFELRKVMLKHHLVRHVITC